MEHTLPESLPSRVALQNVIQSLIYVIFYSMCLEKNGCYSILITSDYLFHNIYAVLASTAILVDHLFWWITLIISGNLNRCVVFSDGAPTHFKQKFTMCRMTLLLHSLFSVEFFFFFLPQAARNGQWMKLEVELRVIYLTQH